MGLFSKPIEWYIDSRISRIRKATENPVETQHETFRQLIASGRKTAFGVEHDFHQISTVEDFRQKVPIRTYDELKPWFDRIISGQPDVVWPGKVSWFSKSSGTTSDRSKFIPVTNDALQTCHFRGGKDVMTLYRKRYPNSKVLNGKCLVLGGSTGVNQLNESIHYGDVSAVMLKNLPWVARINRVPHLNIALMDEWELKLQRIAESCIKEDVSYLAGVPSWMMV